MLKKAVAYYRANGKDKAPKEFMRKDSPFIHRDLYITAYDFQGNSLAHINPRFVDPVTHKAESKRMYFERIDDLVLACGAYNTN